MMEKKNKKDLKTLLIGVPLETRTIDEPLSYSGLDVIKVSSNSRTTGPRTGTTNQTSGSVQQVILETHNRPTMVLGIKIVEKTKTFNIGKATMVRGIFVKHILNCFRILFTSARCTEPPCSNR